MHFSTAATKTPGHGGLRAVALGPLPALRVLQTQEETERMGGLVSENPPPRSASPPAECVILQAYSL